MLHRMRPAAEFPRNRADGVGDSGVCGIRNDFDMAHAAGGLEVIDSFSILGVSSLAEALAVALVAHQGDRASCEVSRATLAEKLGLTSPRVTFALTELERGGWLTISRRRGFPSRFAMAPVVVTMLSSKAEEHRTLFALGPERMTAPQALSLARRAGCRVYLDERRHPCVQGPRDAMRGVIAELRAAEVVDSLAAWLQERDLGECDAVHAAQRLLAP